MPLESLLALFPSSVSLWIAAATAFPNVPTGQMKKTVTVSNFFLRCDFAKRDVNNPVWTSFTRSVFLSLFGQGTVRLSGVMSVPFRTGCLFDKANFARLSRRAVAPSELTTRGHGSLDRVGTVGIVFSLRTWLLPLLKEQRMCSD